MPQVVTMVTMIWTFRLEPLIYFPEEWVWPLERLLAFPTGVNGAVILRSIFNSTMNDKLYKQGDQMGWPNEWSVQSPTLGDRGIQPHGF